ncbi:ABC transporter permease subunit [Roseomonas nepalensis]|uniref:ABC transporter permease subunit n=1 Tax=Muricoccus nepalensis TaxID=1854500 RepID=A0A502G9Z0_9PROT|nr:ABC transporter permease subunit [Roseomonas nepalensis]TPG58130.1 ABC transporter permease subunit [Roseomonas nepalensis]
MTRSPLMAALMVMPLVLLVVAGGVVPLGLLLSRAVLEREVAPALPRTAGALQRWDGTGLPDDAAFETLAADLAALRAAGAPGTAALARAAARLVADLPVLEGVLPGTAERVAETRTGRAVSVLVADPAWGEAETWAALRQAGAPASAFHPLAALGLRRTAAGGLEDSAQGPHARAILARGVGGAALATLACLVIAWPLARWIAEAPPGRAAPRAALAALPLLAGEAARAAGWSVLTEGGTAVALAALALGLVPLMALPVALALRRAGPDLPRAAAALGVPPGMVLRRVRLPLARRGIAAGAALVFAQALGALAVPAVLLPGRPLASTVLAAAAGAGEWGEAGALAAWLLVPALVAAGLLLGPLLRPRRGVAA